MEMIQTVLESAGSVIARQAPWIIGFGVGFAALGLVQSWACNPGKMWWRSRDLFIDLAHLFLNDMLAPAIRIIALSMILLTLHGTVRPEDVSRFFAEGNGVLSGAPLWLQVVIYMLGTDFLLYWSHRLFHGPRLWPFHAVHHAPVDLDWTATYRVHPVNRLLGAAMVNLIMIGLGVPPWLMLALVPFDTITAAWVHANLNWTLGPLKYIIATPVFHRWHHTGVDEGGDKNFAPTFAIWDVLFGTFYMPEGKLPSNYGVDDPDFPKTFAGQLFMPFVMVWNSFKPKAVASPAAKE